MNAKELRGDKGDEMIPRFFKRYERKRSVKTVRRMLRDLMLSGF